jgi:hypothetical protein
VPLRFTTAFTYQLPFGKGRPLLSNNRALDYAIGGVLTLVGARMAWGRYRTARDRRARLVANLQINTI